MQLTKQKLAQLHEEEEAHEPNNNNNNNEWSFSNKNQITTCNGYGKFQAQGQAKGAEWPATGLAKNGTGPAAAAANGGIVLVERLGKSEPEQREGQRPEREAPPSEKESPKAFEAPLVWRNIFLFVLLHSALPIGLYMIYTRGWPKWQTVVWTFVTTYASGLGVTGGAHRLWSHKAYKVRLPVELLLMALQTMAGQNSIYTWCRDHRVHHKFSETNADPHNIKRGFFFAHMGWLCCRKHPEVKEKGALIDMSDLEANPVVMFQHRHFWWLALVFTMLLPTLVPVLAWGESAYVSFVIGFMWRYIISLHGTWLVNSAAHYHGMRPYDKRMEARESPWVIWTCIGEGFHNYHHTFPYDYSTSEYGAYFNFTTAFIDLCAGLGLVYDRRKVHAEVIRQRRLRTGDLHELQLGVGQKCEPLEGRTERRHANGQEVVDAKIK